MVILLTIHSVLRWAIVVLAAVAIFRYVLGWMRGGSFGRLERCLLSAFGGLVDLQILLGFIYFFWTGLAAGIGFPMFRIEHMATMFLAAVVAHLPSMWKKQSDQKRWRNSLFAVVGALALIFIGVARLPGGWSR